MSRERGGIEFIVLAIVILASFLLVGGSFTFHSSNLQNPNQSYTIEQNTPTPAPGGASGPGTGSSPNSQQSLQIEGLGAASPTPSPSPSSTCNHDNGQIVANTGVPVTDVTCRCAANLVTCSNKQCVSSYNQVSKTEFNCQPTWLYNQWCSTPSLAGTGTGVYCIGKPVIYLYPKKDTMVNVSVSTKGSIVESIPNYPINGWKNILAHPDGHFEYNGKTYNELYYESSVNSVQEPENGIVVKTKDLKNSLYSLTYKLGLITPEQKELVNYWLPKLDALNSPYIFISVIPNSEKQKIDRVDINPLPQTKIEFLLYFKPLSYEYSPKPLNLPSNPPERIGFTSVEWGGTIGN